MEKWMCSVCKEKLAVYYYMPSYKGKIEAEEYFCDDCVPRGCSCEENHVDPNAYGPEPLSEPYLPKGIEGVDWKWIEKDKIWCSIDEKGRQYPCCEFMYDEDGFEKDEDEN